MLRVDPKKDRATEDGRFHPGDPSIGRLPTKVPAEWLNAVQEEIANVIESRGVALDPAKSNQLFEAILDVDLYGVQTKVHPIADNVEGKTDFPLEPLDGKKHKFVFFNAVSVRHTTKADMTFFTSHVALYNAESQRWSLATEFDPVITEFGSNPNPGKTAPAQTIVGPHLLSISSTGQLQYQTSKLDGENHKGALTLTHFKYVRA